MEDRRPISTCKHPNHKGSRENRKMANASKGICMACFQQDYRARKAVAQGFTPAGMVQQQKRYDTACAAIRHGLLEFGFTHIQAEAMLKLCAKHSDMMAEFLGVDVDDEPVVNVKVKAPQWEKDEQFEPAPSPSYKADAEKAPASDAVDVDRDAGVNEKCP